VALVPKSHIDNFRLVRLRATCFSDSNWTRGIWIHDPRACFLVTDNNDLRDIGPGTKLRLLGGGQRVVEQVIDKQVWLSGGPLDPDKDGYPHRIDVLE
jgi:hypothetical protein